MADMRKGNLIWKENLDANKPSNPVHSKDVNSDDVKARVDLLATDSKLEQVRSILSGVATEDKLEEARVLLASVATEMNFAREELERIRKKDFATETTLLDLLNKLETLETEMQAVKTAMTDGSQKVQLSGTLPVIYISRLEDRPSATEVEIGQFVILTDEELSTWVSNGVNWVEVL